MCSPLPRYADLPITPKGAHRCSWGIFGEDDELGTLNLLTPERALAATRLPKSGNSFSLNWDLELPRPAILGRQSLRHSVVDLAPIAHPGTDDFYDGFWPQASSQWDSLGHIGHPEAGFYNHRSLKDVLSGRNGIHNAARHGIVSRFLLLDLERYLVSIGRPIDQSRTVAVGVDILAAALAASGATVQPGDVLLLRFGWVGWYETTDQVTRDRMASTGYFPSPGLEADDSVAEWLWDSGFAAVVSDNPILEAMPPDPTRPDGFLHYLLIPLLGMTIGELFTLDDLSRECAALGTNVGLFVASPLNKFGGAGSTANAIAIL